ncbi:hypothetical protein HCTETULN_177 [Candidatus Hodgkinia cicadicola]|nr:hypothetical protein HCTETULN_177 [Candidatus Hodgkinia cicadicola]
MAYYFVDSSSVLNWLAPALLNNYTLSCFELTEFGSNVRSLYHFPVSCFIRSALSCAIAVALYAYLSKSALPAALSLFKPLSSLARLCWGARNLIVLWLLIAT